MSHNSQTSMWVKLKNWVVYVVECVPTNIVFKMLMMPSIIVMRVYDFGLHSMAKSMHSWMFGLILVMWITHQSNDIIM